MQQSVQPGRICDNTSLLRIRVLDVAHGTRQVRPRLIETIQRFDLVIAGAGEFILRREHFDVGGHARLEAALRVWRLIEARRRGVPAFRIFSDRTLRALATSRPGTAQELLAVPGIGISTVEKYGRDIYRVLRENGG